MIAERTEQMKAKNRNAALLANGWTLRCRENAPVLGPAPAQYGLETLLDIFRSMGIRYCRRPGSRNGLL